MSKNLKTIMLTFVLLMSIFFIGGYKANAANYITYYDGYTKDQSGNVMNSGKGRQSGDPVKITETSNVYNQTKYKAGITRTGYDFIGWAVN
ncbi:MAG: hypothetical protein Q4E75_06480 [bacterium]|nr:hypothetical protein [bacterium]